MLTYTARPYPSGGGSYELELYLAVDKCEGLPRGFYHYDAGGHALVPIGVRKHEFEALLKAAEFAMGAPAVPQILITIAARFGRISWKYSSIAYALILKDVGVLMQTFYLMATDMGLGGCAIGTTNIDLFAKMTGIEFHVEGPVGQFALGRGAEPAPFSLTIRRPHQLARSFWASKNRAAEGSRDAAGVEISDRLVAPLSGQREHGALRVRASRDPAAAGHFKRALEDPAATGLDALRRRVDVVDVEVVKPEGHGNHRRFGGHAADRLASGGEQLICAHRVDVGVCFSPAKKLAVERKRLLPVGGEQFVPADAARCCPTRRVAPDRGSAA